MMSRDDFKRLIEKNQEIEHLKKETQDIIEKVKDIDLREFKELIQKHDFYLKRLIELHPSKFSYQEKNMVLIKSLKLIFLKISLE